jgi:hypothetical protein
MPEHRSGCPINLATEVLGDKWSLVILRDLMFGDPHYFREPQGAGPKHRCCLAGQATAIRMCGLSAGFSHPSTASSSALGRAMQPSV